MYVAKKEEYSTILKSKARKRLSLKRKRPITYTMADEPDEEGVASGYSHVEDKLDKVCLYVYFDQ